MSSPFNPLSALTPNPGLTPLQVNTSPSNPSNPNPSNPTNAAANPNPNAQGVSPHPFLHPSPMTPGTPWLALVNNLGAGNPNPANLPATGTPGMSLPLPLPLPGPGPTLTAGLSAHANSDLEESMRAIPDISRLVERAEAVRSEIAGLERGVFGSGEGAERAGALCRLEALQLDYLQTLMGLIECSGRFLVGALPVSLSSITESAAAQAPGTSAAPAPAGATGPPAAPAAPNPNNPTPAVPTTAELATWTEARAQTMFARREAVRNASRAVGDVLKGVKQ